MLELFGASQVRGIRRVSCGQAADKGWVWQPGEFLIWRANTIFYSKITGVLAANCSKPRAIRVVDVDGGRNFGISMGTLVPKFA